MKNYYRKKTELIDLWVEWRDKLEIDWSIVQEQVEEYKLN